MNLIDNIKLGFKVATQKEVIIILIVCILFIGLANYVIKYRKKPPRLNTSKPAKPASDSAPAGEAAAAEGKDASQEE